MGRLPAHLHRAIKPLDLEPGVVPLCFCGLDGQPEPFLLAVRLKYDLLQEGAVGLSAPEDEGLPQKTIAGVLALRFWHSASEAESIAASLPDSSRRALMALANFCSLASSSCEKVHLEHQHGSDSIPRAFWGGGDGRLQCPENRWGCATLILVRASASIASVTLASFSASLSLSSRRTSRDLLPSSSVSVR